MKEKDINIKINDYILNSRAVAIIIENNKILFQKRKQDKFWALPGGKIQIGETSEKTIKRELHEELGIKDFKIIRIHSISEHFFTFEKEKYHQYIFSYIVKLKDKKDLLENEMFEGIEQQENLVFKWFDINTINKMPIKPDFLKEDLLNLGSKQVIFNIHIENK